MDSAQAQSILGFQDDKNAAQVFRQTNSPPFDFQIVTFTLVSGVALPPESAKKIGFPFQTLYVVKCAHPSLVVKFRPNNDSSYQGALELTEKDSYDFGQQVANGFIHWDAQSVLSSGVSQDVTILFASKGNFKSGSLSNVKGGVNTDQYSSAVQGNLTLAAGTAQNLTENAAVNQIPSFTANKTPRQVLIQNNTGANLYVGPTNLIDDGSGSAGANIGFSIAAGDSFKWNNKTSLWGYSTLGGKVNFTAEY